MENQFHPFFRLEGCIPSSDSKVFVLASLLHTRRSLFSILKPVALTQAMWDDVPEPLMLAAKATAIFVIFFIIFTAVLKMLDKITDEGLNGVCKEHAKRSIASRASHAKTKHMQNDSCHESHGSDTPTGSGKALRGKKALENCTTRSSREPSSSSGSQSPTRVGDGTRSSPTRGSKAHGADQRAFKDQYPRVDLSASDSNLYRRDIPMRFNEETGSPQWTSYAKSRFPKHWAQTEDDTEGNEKPALQQGQRQQVKQKDTRDRRYQQKHPTHVSKRHSADLQVRNSFLSQSLSTLDGDRHAQHRDKTRQVQDVPQKGMVLSNSSAMLALYGKEYESLKQQIQHIEKLAKNFTVPKGKGLSVSCGEIWEDGEDVMKELSPGKRRLIWDTLNDNEFNTEI